MTNDTSAKILLLGKTGVGKSSFINYFIGKNVAETGKGKPVTQNYCEEYEYNDGKYPIKIYDNKGFEAKTASEQKKAIISMVQKQNNSDNIFNWFHTIFYCVSAQNNRFEPFEANFLQDLSKSISQNIHIILTKCDGVDRQSLDNLKNYIIQQLGEAKDNIHIFEVVNVSKIKATGEVVVPYGREALSASVFRVLWKDILSKISREYAKEVRSSEIETIEKICNRFKDEAKYSKIFKSAFSSLNNDILDEEINKIIAMCNYKYSDKLKPISDLYVSYCNSVLNTPFIEKVRLDFNSWGINIDDTDKLSDECLKIYFPILSNNEIITSTSKKLIYLPAISFELTTMKIRLRLAINMSKKFFIDSIPSEEDIAKETEEKLMKFLDNFCFIDDTAMKN